MGRKKSIEKRLQEIQLTVPEAKNRNGQSLEQVTQFPSAIAGRPMVEIRHSQIKSDPIYYLKTYPRLIGLTNAKGDQELIELIQNTPLAELRRMAILSNTKTQEENE